MSGFLSRMVLVSVCASTAVGERTIAADDYLDKLRGMWLGQLIGNMAGRPTEGVYAWGEPNPAQSVPWVLLAEWPADDDTDLEYVAHHILLDRGLEPTGAVLREEWLVHVPLEGIYIANRQARYLMDAGLEPPLTGALHQNVAWNAIDAQIATESLGALAPGLRQCALTRVGTFARISNDGFAVHAAQFYAAMYAAAIFERDVPTLIERGLEAIPRSSRTASVIRDVRAWHAVEPDWRATRRLLYEHYQGSHSFGRYIYWIESTINVGATTLALLYGEGDFERSVQIAILAGWDSDCNPATAGGLLGLVYGYSGLPPALTAQCGDVYRNDARPDLPVSGVPLPQYDSIVAICSRAQAVAEQVIVAAGGRITSAGGQRFYHLPDADPVTPEPELPDPNEAAGLVGALRGIGAPVVVSAGVEYHDPLRDRYNLAAVADGITDPRHNGHLPYWTRDSEPNQPSGGDFYQLDFARMVRVDRVIFHEGDLYPAQFNANPFTAQRDGGFFVDLTVEVRRGRSWYIAPRLVQNPTLDRYVPYQTIRFDFDPQWCDAIRIRGEAGGDQQFTTILELEAYGSLGVPVSPGDLNGDGRVDFGDINPFVLALTDLRGFVVQYPEVNPYAAADINGDGRIDFGDINPFVALLADRGWPARPA
ncbi:MAG: ADP-ribosylglycohydrolase family protein [Planctomycetota bacterium]